MSYENLNQSNIFDRLLNTTQTFIDNISRPQSLIVGAIIGFLMAYLIKTFLMTFFAFSTICLIINILGYIRIDEERLQYHAELIWNRISSFRVTSGKELIEKGKELTMEHTWMAISTVCTFFISLVLL